MLEQLRTSPELVYVIYTGIAVGVFLLFNGLAQLLSRRENRSEAKNRRLKMIASGASTAEILAILKPAANTGWVARVPLFSNLPTTLRKAGIFASPSFFLLLCGISGFAVLIVATFFIGPLMAVGFALFFGFVVPIMVLRFRVKERDAKFLSQLPDALDLMARGLRVGHPLNTSIHEVAQEMPDPIASEFGIIFDQVNFGDDLVDAFRDLADRVDLEDIYYLAASIGIQHGTGGDLARIISVLSTVVRGRITMRRRILAISSEGRLTGWFLSLLPVLIFVTTSMLSPDYYAGVMDDPLFKPVAIAIVSLTVVNFLAIRKLVNFRV